MRFRLTWSKNKVILLIYIFSFAVFLRKAKQSALVSQLKQDLITV
jgi:hypothetical protein